MTALNLYPFQRTGARALIERPRVLLGDEMGLGKTVQAAVALRQLFECGAAHRAVIVCPASLCVNWKHEVGKWAGLASVIYEGPDRFGMLYGNAAVVIGSFDTVASDLRTPTRSGTVFHDIGVDVVIVDEAQRIKDPASLRSKVLAKLLAARRWAITGTPVENHPRELASILRFLYPNEFITDTDFDDLRKILRHRDACLLRRTKQQVGLELPNKTVGSVTIALTPSQHLEYARRLSVLKESLSRGGRSQGQAVMHLLAGIQDLRRIAVIGEDGASSKLDYLEDAIESIVASGEKVVVFSSFANIAIPHFYRRLSRFGALAYTGAMAQEQRQATHHRFLTDPNAGVMFASLKAAGVGLTWTVASHVFHTDVWWNPQVLNQADDRVHRIGQEKPVFIRRLLADNTIEVAINELLDKKEEISDLLIDDAPLNAAPQQIINDLLAMIGLETGKAL
jgi:SNF2 family DNA or RNA helicase